MMIPKPFSFSIVLCPLLKERGGTSMCYSVISAAADPDNTNASRFRQRIVGYSSLLL
jgi:hypothetical protein